MWLAQWRRVLPIAQFLIYLPLVWYGCWYRPTWQHWYDTWASPSSEMAGFYPAWIDGVESLPEQVAAGLNFPAVVAAVLSVMPFESQLRTGASRELAMHILTSLYIPFLWYVTGRQIDQRSDMGTGPLSKRMKVLAVFAVVALLLAGSLLLWSFAEGQRYTMSILSLCWIVGGLLVIGARLRRSPGNAPSS